VLARDDHHAIARRQQLIQLYANALELPEHALVVRDRRLATTVDTRLRRAA
jgi:vacuolar-type H+-ATPase subunit B/Vma2